MGFALAHLIAALTAQDLLEQASEALREAVPHWRHNGLVLFFCEHAALLAAKQGRHADAARLAGTADAYHQRNGITRPPNEERSRADLLKRFADALISRQDLDRWMLEGAVLDTDAVVALCLIGT